LTNSVDGNAGNIVLKSKTSITTGLLDAGTYNYGNGGNISLSAVRDISTSTIVTYSNGSGKSGNVSLVSTKGAIRTTNSSFDTSARYINTSGNGGNAGSVDMRAYGDIVNYGIYSNSNSGAGGNVNLRSTTGHIYGNDIVTYANADNGGNVTLNAYSDITGGAIVSSSASKNAGVIQVISTEGNIDFGQSKVSAGSGQGSGANITLTAKSKQKDRTITVGLIDAGANGDGNGGNVKLSAKGDILTSAIATNSNGNGKSGNVSLVSSSGNIKTTNDSPDTSDRYIYAAANGGNAGSITVNAFGDIVTNSIQANSNGGVGGTVKLTSQMGKINTNGGLISTTSLTGGNAGTITLNSAKDIKVGNIFARSRDAEISPSGVVWNGGAVNITSFGNIETGSITTTSLTGAGGNIRLLASGESIKVLNTLKQDDIDYSIISAGATANGRVTIQRKSGSTGSFFAVGDATYNGTKGAISTGKDANGIENILLATTIVAGTYIDGNIRILTPDIPAPLSRPRTIPIESPTTTYSFTPVPSSKVQELIDRGEYNKAVVALDNLRTIEFYQSQGNTSPTVAQLNSVNQIKNFLNAGDSATGTKSAMIYTFLSGVTDLNPSGTSLNLFALTSTSDVIYKTIPLINGLYQNTTVSKTVLDFRDGVRDPIGEDYKDPASRLYDLIFKPLKDALSLFQVNNLIFSNDSLFRTIPLAALYDKQTSKFLVEDFSNSVAPSFQVIEKDRYKSLQGANVLKMGATVFGSEKPLPSVRTELENIAQIELQNSPSTRHSPIYLNNQFSSSNLKTFIAKNDAPIVHFSTHGVASPGSESFILLGTNNSGGQSDRLNASDIRQLKNLSNKDLLVFSTCLSFTGSDYGTTGAALVAGVKSVIGCGWVVSDSSTMVAMTGFYQQLLGNGLSKTKALQEAQKSMILGNVKLINVAGTTDRAELSIDGNKVISSEYGQKDIKSKINPDTNYLSHPFYWATFSLIGNPW